MSLQIDRDHLGVPESAWMASARLRDCRPMDWGAPGRVVVLAPHPDDEVLAVGGSMRALSRAGHGIHVVAVTNGEASHPRSRAISRAQLARRRDRERARALADLGVDDCRTTHLHCPDGRVAHVADLVERFTELLVGASWCVAPWDHDGHPDHDATGRAAITAAGIAGVRLAQYPVWAWHWAEPATDDLPWARARLVHLERETVDAKRDAIAAYRTQTEPVGPAEEDEPILPAPVLARFFRPFEVVFT